MCVPEPGAIPSISSQADAWAAYAEGNRCAAEQNALPPPPEVCAQFPFVLGFPRVGSKEWCLAQADVLAAFKSLGATMLDWIIQGCQKGIDLVWNWANVKVGESCGGNWTFGGGATGIFSQLANMPNFAVKLGACIFDAFKWAVGNGVYLNLRGAQQLACAVRNAQANAQYMDMGTYLEIWSVSWVWSSIKTLRIGSPTWLAFQTNVQDLKDYISQLLVYLLHSVSQNTPPCELEAMECYLHNTIDATQYTCWMNLGDRNTAVWKPVLDARRHKLTTDEVIEWTRRRSLGDVAAWQPQSPYSRDEAGTEQRWQDESLGLMRGLGWLYQRDAVPAYALYDELPTIADHLHWLARNIDDVSYVQDYHLLDGFSTPEDVASIIGPSAEPPMPQSLKRNFWATFGAELRAQGMRKIDAARHYAAHWLHGSPEQLRSFVFRLRPGRPLKDWESVIASGLGTPAAAGSPAPTSMTFTAQDFTRILTEQDYGYKDVGWFASTLYHVPALSYLRDMYRYGIFSAQAIASNLLPAGATVEQRQAYDDDVLAGYHRDLGYSEQDSSRFVAVDRLIKNRIRMSEAFGWTPSALARAFAIGQITEKQARGWMTYQGFNDAESTAMIERAGSQLRYSVLKRAYSLSVTSAMRAALVQYDEGLTDKAGAVAALQALGVDKVRAGALVDVEGNRRLTRQIKEVKRALRRAYLSGRIDDKAAQQIMDKLGLDKAASVPEIDAWFVEKTVMEKAPTKAEIIRWLKEGLLTAEEAQLRLTNLGIAADAVELLLDEVDYLEAKAEKKAEAAAKKQEQREQATAAKEAERAAAAALRQAQSEAKDEARAEERAVAAAEKQAEKEARAAAQAEHAAAAAGLLAERTAEKAALTAAKKALAAAKAAVARAKADEPPAKLQAWAELGMIGYNYFHERMSIYGYDDGSIRLWWDQACAKKSAACIDGKQPLVGTGGSAPAG